MQLPPLPRLNDRHKLGQLLRGPTELDNWVIPGMLLCGPYPGAFEDRKNNQLLRRVLSKGVDTFVCLQEELDIEVPEEVWRSGIALRPYFYDAQKLAKKDLKWVQLPMADGNVAPDSETAQLVVLMAEHMKAGRVLYLHCFGGHGRTGVICCLLLSYLYRISAAEAMKRVQAYHDCRIDHQGAKSPQTVVQREQVKRQTQELLRCQAPEVEIMREQERTPVGSDVSKRGCMMPSKKSPQASSCPTLGGLDEGDMPQRQRPIKLKTSIHDHAMPDYLTLPNVLPKVISAKTKREMIMQQKANAAALKRKSLAKSTSEVLDNLVAAW
mmetsp:Transcript_106588/g.188745  ORF Transcript_106588/g.188745 Transcript_106588/m.188745 type:complete len:325 (-) Transcript_106588:113-1087(-)